MNIRIQLFPVDGTEPKSVILNFQLLVAHQLCWLRAGRSGDRIQVEARFSAPVQTGPWAYPASYTMGTGSFLGVKRQGVAFTTHPHLAPRLKKEQSYTSTPPLGLRGLF